MTSAPASAKAIAIAWPMPARRARDQCLQTGKRFGLGSDRRGFLGRWKSHEQFAHGSLQRRVHSIRCDLGERSENKAPFVHARMRKRRIGCRENEVIDEQQIEIESPRAVFLSPLPAMLRFDFHQPDKNRFRTERRVEFDDAVEKRRLVRRAADCEVLWKWRPGRRGCPAYR